MNKELRSSVSDIEHRLAKARKHLAKVGLPPDQVNGLYGFLGKGVKGVWENNLAGHLDKMLFLNRDELVKQNQDHSGEVNLLNYVLSSCNFTPGETDRTIALRTSREIPYEPWMIDENWVISQAGGGIPWREAFVSGMDKNPPPPTPFASVPELRRAISGNNVLFTPADNDAYVPAETYIEMIAKFEVPGHTAIKRLPGGHSAIFLEEGHRALKAWAASLSSSEIARG